MKRNIIIAVLMVLFGITGFANPEGKTKINIILKEQSDPVALSRDASWLPSKQERRDFVVETLKRQTAASQYDVLSLLHELEQNGLVSEIRPLWIVNSISCYADESVIPEIGNRNDILTVYPCESLPLMENSPAIPVDRGNGREITENLLQVNADRVWDLGYTGKGITIAIIDTGVSLTHADLQGRFWDGGPEYPNHGYDFADHDYDPSDTDGHGTHVAGTICGTGVSGSQTGVAPDAKLMLLKVFGNDQQTDETVLVEAMQFALEHGADLMNMSLGWPDPSIYVRYLYRQACENTLAAGIVAAVCAGNIRHLQSIVPIPRNIYAPGDCPPPFLHEDQMVNAGGTSCVISVGAVDFNDEITYFSSVGPTTWANVTSYNDYPLTPESHTEIGLIRPDVCAPGLDIKSLDFHDDHGYCLKEGTSMATPCVSGTIALMLSKNPELTPAQIDEILETTAFHITEHKSNDFGSGRIDALAAVSAVNYEGLNEKTQEISVYPNPSSDHFNVTCKGMSQIKVFAIDGRLVQSISTTSDKEKIKGLDNGVYVLQITKGNSRINYRIVKY